MQAILEAMTWAETGALVARGAATVGVVAATLVLLRRGGQALAGLVAAIPVTSAPALAWLGIDRGTAFAAQASLAALYATALSAVYAAAYAVLARRFGRPASLLLAAAATLLACAATHGLATDWRAIAAFTIACFGVAFAALPAVQAPPARTGARPRDIAFTAGVSGTLTVAVTLIAQHVPAQWCGLIAAIPVVGITTICMVHGRWPLANLRAFLRAYAHGLVAKACFVSTLAATLVPFGAPAGWIAALCAAAAALWLRQTVAPWLRAVPRTAFNP